MILLLSAAWAASLELNPGDDVATLTASLLAGDEVLFNPGTYPIASYLDWTGQGTQAEPITLRAKGGEVILEFAGSYEVAYLHDAAWFHIEGITFTQTADNVNGPYAFYVENTENVTITDCTFGPTHRGVYVDGNNTGLSFDHNEIKETTDGHGLYVGCSDASCWTQDSSFANNWIHDIGGQYSYLFYLANGGQGNRVVDNVLYNTPYRGLAVNSTEYGAQNVVAGNAIWGTGETGLLVRGPAVVQNNVLFNLGGHGIYSGDNDRGTLSDAVITHNTVYDSVGWGVYVEQWAGKANMVLANNAVTNTVGYGLYVSDGGVDATNYLSHNVVSGLVDNMELYSGTDTPVIPGGGDADYADPLSWDFYPSAGSLLVNAADASSQAWVPETDFNGAARNGESPDAGAYERSGDSNPGWVLSEGYKVVGELDDGGDDVVGGGCCKKEGGAEETAALVPFAALALLRARRRRG